MTRLYLAALGPPAGQTLPHTHTPALMLRPHAAGNGRPDRTARSVSAQSQFAAHNGGRDLLGRAAGGKSPRPQQRKGVADAATAVL